MAAGPRTLVDNQQQTILVSPARLQLSVPRGSTNSAGTIKHHDQRYRSSSEDSSSETSSDTEDDSSSSTDSVNSRIVRSRESSSETSSSSGDKYGNLIEIWSRIDGDSVIDRNKQNEIIGRRIRGRGSTTSTSESSRSSTSSSSSYESGSEDTSYCSEELDEWIENIEVRKAERQKARAIMMEESISEAKEETIGEPFQEGGKGQSLAQRAHEIFRAQERERRATEWKEYREERNKEQESAKEWHTRMESLIPFYRSIIDELAEINSDEANRREARRRKAQEDWVARRESWEIEL